MLLAGTVFALNLHSPERESLLDTPADLQRWTTAAVQGWLTWVLG